MMRMRIVEFLLVLVVLPYPVLFVLFFLVLLVLYHCHSHCRLFAFFAAFHPPALAQVVHRFVMFFSVYLLCLLVRALIQDYVL